MGLSGGLAACGRKAHDAIAFLGVAEPIAISNARWFFAAVVVVGDGERRRHLELVTNFGLIDCTATSTLCVELNMSVFALSSLSPRMTGPTAMAASAA